MVTLTQAHAIALALPEAEEMDHHGMPSFRIRGKIFATNPDPQHLNIFLDEPGSHAAIAAYPTACAELWWGKNLSGISVTLKHVRGEALSDLLHQSWERRAPKKLIASQAPAT